MSGRVFLDTNVLIYAQSASEPDKREVFSKLLRDNSCVISVQVINELCNVLIKRFSVPIDSIRQFIQAITATCIVVEISTDTTRGALDIRERYGYSYYDSLIIAAALQAECEVLYTEDLQNGQIIGDCLRIQNPYEKRA